MRKIGGFDDRELDWGAIASSEGITTFRLNGIDIGVSGLEDDGPAVATLGTTVAPAGTAVETVGAPTGTDMGTVG